MEEDRRPKEQTNRYASNADGQEVQHGECTVVHNKAKAGRSIPAAS